MAIRDFGGELSDDSIDYWSHKPKHTNHYTALPTRPSIDVQSENGQPIDVRLHVLVSQSPASQHTFHAGAQPGISSCQAGARRPWFLDSGTIGYNLDSRLRADVLRSFQDVAYMVTKKSIL